LVFAALVVGVALVAKRFPALGALLALWPSVAIFVGLIVWLVTDYFRPRI
jgi:hypothetical protein